MTRSRKYLSAVAVAAGVLIAAGFSGPAASQDGDGTIGEGLVMYFQMGGNPGGGATLARTNGARAAAEAFGVDLREQYSAWQPDVMINQFKEAMAGNPDCIEMMGHPGNDAFWDLAAEARERGIVLTSGNSQLSDLFNEYRQSGFGFVGMDNYRSGRLVAGATIKNAGLKEGDRVMVYGLLSQDERGKLERGALDVYEENNMTIDYIEISPEVNADPSLAVPILVAYIERTPDVKSIITSHGTVTGFLGKALKEAGKQPGEIFGAGYDIVPAAVEAVQEGYVHVLFDQNLFLQGFLPVVQCVLSSTYAIPGLDIDTGIGLVTPDNIDQLIPEIEAGIR
ncbi:MAG: substrate-binding domain-containing protein [Rhodospirillales bacterium]|nr:substrate-binding domain-containing protein [Rhodospirillales bacterium]MDE0378390.1 substrate-binding domain-containing protein [Rhodospirillales bacterium]